MNQRMQSVQAPIIPIVAQWIRESPGTISLGQGVVSYPPPPQAQEQLAAFWADPNNHLYQAVHGIPSLREAITQKLAQDNHLHLSDQQAVVVTAGSNLAFSNAIFAIADPGDEIILPTPFYFNHDMAINQASCRTVGVPVDEQYQLQLDAIEAAITPNTKAIVTVSPNNPSGVVYPEADLRAVNELCRKHGLYHLHDEAYEYFTYDGAESFSPGSIPGSEAYTISLYSLSKAYGFASWRIGYMVIPSDLFDSVRKIQDTQLICPAVITQYAALGALSAGKSWCKAQQAPIVQARNLFAQELQQLGNRYDLPETRGAFYYLLRLHTDQDANDLAEQLVRKHKVAVIPGGTFGFETGCYLRVAYGALPIKTAREGIGRLVNGLQKLL